MRVGVLGGGQLGRMLGLAGIPLGIRFRFLDPGPDAPARQVGEWIRGGYGKLEALETFVSGLDLVTWEFENVPVETAQTLRDRVAVRPNPVALERAQDRKVEKQLFRSLGIPTASFRTVDSREELLRAGADLGFPAVLKTRRMGYDGKGQRLLQSARDVDGAWAELQGSPLILEAFVPFRRELSIVGARGKDGKVVFYPLVENRHRSGILVRTEAPAPQVPSALEELAQSYLRRLMGEMEYVGVLALELFHVGDDLFANEMAPRVHNSGHWTQDGALTSQFENHIRAVTGLPLGPTDPEGVTIMVNTIGRVPSPAAVLRLPGTHLHLYDKVPRPGRKLGHVNVRGATRADARERARAVEELLGDLEGHQ